MPVSRLAPIYQWLGDLLINWDGHMQQALALCLEGLELVGDAKTVESAMIEGILGFVYEMTGEATKHAEIARHLETYVLELPYQAELSTAFGVVGIYYFNGKNMAEAMHWREEALKRYWAAHDLRRVGDFPLGFWGLLLGADSEEVLGGLREARKLLVQVGDDKRVNRNDVETGIVAYMYGELDTALTHLRRATLDAPGINDEHLPDMQRWLGETHIGAWRVRARSRGSKGGDIAL